MRSVVAALLFAILTVCPARADETDLAGLWEARRHFGPEVRGTLTLIREGASWRAEIAGRSTPVASAERRLRFALPGDRGSFDAPLDDAGQPYGAHWLQGRMVAHGLRFASPVELVRIAEDRWQGEVVPLEDELTLHLAVRRREDESLGAFLRNPERNLGVFWNLDRLEPDSESVRWIGRFFRSPDERTLTEGRHQPEDDRLSVYLGGRGGTYDFERRDDPSSSFYARGREPLAFVYRTPPRLDDGWPVGTLESVGIALEPIRRMIEEEITPAPESVHSLYIHGLLIARHGRLALEEYFYGFHRQRPHDTRSASKSLTAALIGAAIADGTPLDTSSSVLRSLDRGETTSAADPRWDRMTVEHLLTMSSGLDCDDRDPSSRGNEDVMQEQTEETDWYRYTRALNMVREPGEVSLYCSAGANLLGAVIAAATREPLQDSILRLIAEPLQISRYYLPLQPTAEPYMGGGIHWLPRDFAKLGQLMLDDGEWNGRRVLDSQWAQRAVSPLVALRGKGYGYLWWVVDYPYRGGQVRAFFAGGNGGQVVVGIPELDLMIAAFAGNYNDAVLYRFQDELIPQYILPAVIPAP
jgi:CubicO group peptidase (beta-lactamase class C family)